MNLRSILSVLFAAVLLLAVAGSAVRAADPPAVNTSAPDFTLKSQENKTVSLHDFKGKWVVLYFYPKDMTPGCTIEAHNFQADQTKYDKMNAAIVGVSVDAVDSHVEFCTKRKPDLQTALRRGSQSGEYVRIHAEVRANRGGRAEHVHRRPERDDPQGVPEG